MIGLTVVGNEQATVITSSPFRIRRSPNFSEVNVEKAAKFALEPELTRVAYLTPTNLLNSLQNSSAKCPSVSQNSKDASIAFSISLSSNTLPETLTGVIPGIKVLFK